MSSSSSDINQDPPTLESISEQPFTQDTSILSFLPSFLYSPLSSPTSTNPQPQRPLSPIKSHDDHIPEFNILKEVVPGLHNSVLNEILKGNHFDLEKSIDAALALFTSLSIEKGTAVIGPPTDTHLRLYSDEKSPDRKNAHLSVSTRLVEPIQGKSGRGAPMILDMHFLNIPRYRLYIDHHQSSCTSFTISFLRLVDKLGITIQEIEGEITIHQLHLHNSRPCLAMEAGVRIGDIITGINGEYFSPGVEVQDVLDILELAGRFVTLHFNRRHTSDDSPYHKFAQLLLDQNVIKKEKALYVSRVLHRLRDRVLQWDSGYISQRIENWKLYKGVALNKGVTSIGFDPASTTTSFFGSILPTTTAGSGITLQGSDLADNSALRRGRNIWDPTAIFNINITPKNQTGYLDTPDTSQSNSGIGVKDNSIVIATKNLRPALSLRLIRAEEKGDHIVYIVWVMDVKSGAEWTVKRRFREFYDFRELLISIRPSISQLEFPPKRLSVGETTALVLERITLLQKFLRRVSSLVTSNSLHPSTARVQLAIQQFLDVSDHWYAITVMEKRPNLYLKNIVQVFVHSVMQMSVMDKVLATFLENFLDDATEDDRRSLDDWNILIGRKIVTSLRDYIDNLQNILFDGLSEDCIDIIRRYLLKGGELESTASFARYKQSIPTTLSSAGSYPSSSSQPSLEATQYFKRLSEDEIRQVTRSAIRKQVEVEIYIPCAARLSKVLELSCAKSDAQLQKKIRVLLNHDQHFFGIPPKQVSPTNWEDIVTQIRQLRLKTLPHDRLESLIDAAKEIPKLFQKEHPGAERPLGADELLPIFIYVLVHSEMTDLLALNEELQALCDPDKRLSETGYYLATLEATIQHLTEFDEEGGVESFFNRNTIQPIMSGSSDRDIDDQIHRAPSDDAMSQASYTNTPVRTPVNISSTMQLSSLGMTPGGTIYDSAMSPAAGLFAALGGLSWHNSADSHDSSTNYGDGDLRINSTDTSEF